MANALTSQENSENAGSGSTAVLMSVYAGDDPRLFDRAIQSVLDQDYRDGPINLYLCIDGEVPAAIERVVSGHRENLCRIVRNPRRMGLAKSLNHLLRVLGDEEWVFRMDSDDYSVPNRVSLQVAAMRARPDIDILGGGIREVDSAGQFIREVKYPSDSTQIRNHIANRNPLAHPTVCFRRSAIERFKDYPETSVNQDWALWFKCLEMGMGISNLEQTLVHMTTSDSFFVRRGASRALEEFRITSRGILSLHGMSWRLVFPCIRFVFRFAPAGLRRLAYRSRLR